MRSADRGRHRRAGNQQRQRIGKQMGEAAVHEGRKQNPGEPRQLPGTNAEIRGPDVERGAQHLDQPEQCDESRRDLDGEPEVGARAQGARECGIGSVNLHRGTGYQPLPRGKAGDQLQQDAFRRRARRRESGTNRARQDSTPVHTPAAGPKNRAAAVALNSRRGNRRRIAFHRAGFRAPRCAIPASGFSTRAPWGPRSGTRCRRRPLRG